MLGRVWGLQGYGIREGGFRGFLFLFLVDDLLILGIRFLGLLIWTKMGGEGGRPWDGGLMVFKGLI